MITQSWTEEWGGGGLAHVSHASSFFRDGCLTDRADVSVSDDVIALTSTIVTHNEHATKEVFVA